MLAAVSAFAQTYKQQPNTPAPKDTALTFTEIMFNAPIANGEYIEIFNTSRTDSFDVNGYLIKYYTSNPDTIRSSGFGTFIRPRQYAVIFEGDYNPATGGYTGHIPADAKILKIADNAFGSSGMSNSSDRPVSLLRPAGDTIETYTYTVAQNSAGVSDEKFLLTRDNSTVNWKNSLLLNGTPGMKNSVTPFESDIGIASFSAFLSAPSMISIKTTIKNYGWASTDNYMLRLYSDGNNDSIPQASEMLYLTGGPLLRYTDSITLTYNYNPGGLTSVRFIAVVEGAYDQNAQNNKAYTSYGISLRLYDSASVVINEIMYAPQSGEPEWIELYNKSNTVVNLHHCLVGDAATNVAVTNTDYNLLPKKFIVLTRDTTIRHYYSYEFPFIQLNLPSLNNDSDKVILRDTLGFVLDSITYKASWGYSPGRSLERISTDSSGVSKSNWALSLSTYRATPGIKNSVVKKNYDLSLDSLITGSIYSLPGGNAVCTAIVANKGIFASGPFSVQFYDDINFDSRLQPSELAGTAQVSSLLPGTSSTIFFEFQNLSAGNHHLAALILFAADEDTSNNSRFIVFPVISPVCSRGDIVINEIMYAPQSGEPEWIELYNNTPSPVLLKNFLIADAGDSVRLTSSDISLTGNGYLIICPDSTFSRRTGNNCSQITAPLPTLNNTGDKLILLDSLHNVIDSLQYTTFWASIPAASLERVSPSGKSTDSVNWKSSKSPKHYTPGRINSVSAKQIDVSLTSITLTGSHPIRGDSIHFRITIKNTGTNTVFNILCHYTVRALGGTNMSSSGSQAIANLLPGDSISYTESAAYLPADSIEIAAAVNLAGDEYPENDSLSLVFRYAAVTGSILISEVMISPRVNDPEWIEFYNNSGDTLSVNDWIISDVLSTPVSGKIHADNKILPGEYFVVARDSTSTFSGKPYFVTSFGTLNNSADGVIIKDPTGYTIDSMLYDESFNLVPGKSIERRNLTLPAGISSNWHYSLAPGGSTPFVKNTAGEIARVSVGQLIITELLYEPLPGRPQFIELYNPLGSTVQLGGITITAGSTSYDISDTLLTLPAHGYYIIANDSSLYAAYPGLRNSLYTRVIQKSSLGLLKSGCSVILRSIDGISVDSISYLPAYHVKGLTSTAGHSLERINYGLPATGQENWTTSPAREGASPGEPNTAAKVIVSTESTLSFTPNPFSPDGDGFEDVTTIAFNLPFASGYVSISIFDDKGRFARQIAKHVYMPGSGAIVFDGFAENGNPLPMGIYIVLLEATDTQTGRHFAAKKALVSARKL